MSLERQRPPLLGHLIELLEERAPERDAIGRADEGELVAAHADGQADLALDGFEVRVGLPEQQERRAVVVENDTFRVASFGVAVVVSCTLMLMLLGLIRSLANLELRCPSRNVE